jgi:hypothetical protein
LFTRCRAQYSRIWLVPTTLKDLLALLLAEIELVVLEVLGLAGERAPIDPDDALLAVQLLGEDSAQVSADPGDDDGRAHGKARYRGGGLASNAPWRWPWRPPQRRLS